MPAQIHELAVPKYLQISQQIVQEIQSGHLTPGAQVKSENEIIQLYDVSNTTARKALQHLEHEGWVRRIKGKGSFVREKKIERSASRILSFTKNMEEVGRTPSTSLISLHMMEPTRELTINGCEYVLEGPSCKIQRLRSGDGEPLMFETRYISTALCPDLNKIDLEKSLYSIYEHDYGLKLYEIIQVVSVTMLEPELQSYFGLDESVPSFRVEGVTLSGPNTILEMEESVYRGDQYQFTISAVSEMLEH